MSCQSNKTCCGKASVVQHNEEDLRNLIREHYKQIVCSPSSCNTGSCFSKNTSEEYAIKLGYTKDDLSAFSDGANIGLGCGNSVSIAKLKPSEVVLDLGSGAGFDAFLAAKAVGVRLKTTFFVFFLS